MAYPSQIPTDSLQCVLCGAIWDRVSAPPCNHTAEEWAQYQAQNAIPDPMARWKLAPPQE